MALSTSDRRLHEHLRRRYGWLVAKGEPAWLKDGSFRFVAASREFALRQRLRVSDLLGERDSAFFPDWAVEQFHRDDRAVLETGRRIVVEELDRGFANTIKIPLRDEDGNVVGTVGMSQVLGDRQRLPDQLRDEAIGSLEDAMRVFRRLSAAPELDSAPAWLRRGLDLIGLEPFLRMSRENLRDVCGVHPDHLSRAFRAHAGVELRAYRQRLRTAYAVKLLAWSLEPLAGIAHASGFADQSHMTRAFGDLVGTSPARFRRVARFDDSRRRGARLSGPVAGSV